MPVKGDLHHFFSSMTGKEKRKKKPNISSDYVYSIPKRNQHKKPRIMGPTSDQFGAPASSSTMITTHPLIHSAPPVISAPAVPQPGVQPPMDLNSLLMSMKTSMDALNGRMAQQELRLNQMTAAPQVVNNVPTPIRHRQAEVMEVTDNDLDEDEIRYLASSGNTQPSDWKSIAPAGNQLPQGATSTPFHTQPQRSRGRGGKGRGRGRGQDQGRQQNQQRRHSDGSSDSRGGRGGRGGRRGGRGGGNGLNTKQVNNLIDRALCKHKQNEEIADRDIILYGIESKKDDNYKDEIDRAAAKLKMVLSDFTVDLIKGVSRFYAPDAKGFYPMRVTIRRLSIAQELIEEAEDRKFEWFARSRSKQVRKFNGGLVDHCEYLNSTLPPNSSFRWEVTQVGATDVIRRADNPAYIAPAHDPTDQGQPQGANERPTNAKKPRLTQTTA